MSLPDWLDDAPPLTDDDLDAFFAWNENDVELSAESGFAAAKWSVTDKASAEWAMQKYAAAQAEVDQNQALYDKYKGQLDRWLAKANRSHERRRQFFEGHLCDYLRRLREADPSHKSETLPSGAITSRIVPGRPDITDKETFVSWASTFHEDLIRAEWKPVMDAIKKEVEFRFVYVPDGPINSSDLTGRALVAQDDGSLEWPWYENPDGSSHGEWLPVAWWPSRGSAHSALYIVPALREIPETLSITVKPAAP